MKHIGLTRRRLLSLWAAGTAGSIASACGLRSRRPPGASPTRTATSTLPAPGATTSGPARSLPAPTADRHLALSIGSRDGDAWTWKKKVTVRCRGCERCGELYLKVDDRKMDALPDGDRLSTVVPLSEGEHRIVAACLHEDGRQYESQPVTYTQRLVDRPTSAIRLSVQGSSVALDAGDSKPAELRGASIARHEWSAHQSNPSPLYVAGGGRRLTGNLGGRHLRLRAPSVDGEYYISLRVVDAQGRADVGTTYFTVQGGTPEAVDQQTDNPAWVESAVVYGVIPGKFGPDGFRSVTERLDYLRDLGINALWLQPVNATPPGDFGYAVTDYFKLRTDYGVEVDFRRMIREAHARGIRVLMDFVPNHTSEEHPYFQDAQQYGKESAYYSFYDRDETGAYTHYFDWTHLPNLNYDNAEVERLVIEAFSYWVQEFDVDGFRVDAAWGVKERKPDFWPRWRAELKRLKPDLLLLAEATARDPYYFTNGFDAAYDWTDELGHWAWESVFNDAGFLNRRLHGALTNYDTGFDQDALVFRFLNNNDTGPRFITSWGEEMTRVAATLLLTLPGIPCVYTGDEVGAEFMPYSDTAPITWEDKHGLRGYYKRLIHLRKTIPSLHSRRWEPLAIKTSGPLYGYIRYVGSSESPVLVLLNFSGGPADATVSVPRKFEALARAGEVVDVLSGDRVRFKPSEPRLVPMPAWGARILRPEHG